MTVAMEHGEKFCLRWNEFESNLGNALRDLRDNRDFFDLTLACDDAQEIQVHRVILCGLVLGGRSV